jgi:hypothetical protein
MKTTLIGGMLYGGALLYALFMPKSELTSWASYASMIYVVYYLALSMVHHARVHRADTDRTHLQSGESE